MKEFIVLIMSAVIGGSLMAAPPLFENGKSAWQIRYESNADEVIRYAAKELQDALRKISGAELPVSDQEKSPEIIIGINPQLDSDQVSVSLKENRLYLSGGSSSSALYAVYLFLQKELGVRWLWPGESGGFYPEKSVWMIPALDYQYNPVIKYRGFHLCSDWRDVDNFVVWMARNFININRHGRPKWNKYGFHNMVSGHFAGLPKELFKTHPEYFSEIKGKRYDSQPCLSNRAVERLILEKCAKIIDQSPGLEILSIFPPDNMDYCECGECAAKGVSTAWFDFYNRITDNLKERYPELKFSTIAYQGYHNVPKNPVRNSIFVEYATYPRCYIHKLNDGSCPCNVNEMKRIEEWKSTGVTMGNYAYEFDIFYPSRFFLPNLSILEDSIKTSANLNHVSIITEVPLSPKSGPELDAFAVKNRLPLYIYTQLLWNPRADMKSILKDWCTVAYGKAAEPMYRYFLELDQKWNSMKQHKTILGSSAEVAKEFLAGDLAKKAAVLFAEADRLLAGQKNTNVEQEKILFNQWLGSMASAARIVLPKIQDKENIPDDSFAVAGLSIGGAWNDNAIYFKNIKPPFAISLNKGVGMETLSFEVDVTGRQKNWRQTLGGDRNAEPAEWTFRNGVIEIPFKSLGGRFDPITVWNIIIRYGGKTYPADGNTAILHFSSAATEHSVIFWNGAPDREEKLNNLMQEEFTKGGWQFSFADNGTGLSKNKPAVYFFRHPNGPNKVPEECWGKIRKEIRDGGFAVFNSYWQLPLEKYLDDSSFKVRVLGIKTMPLAARKAQFVKEGNWLKSPNDLSARIKFWITPAYGARPEQPELWDVLATMPFDSDSGETVPFIMVRQFGKGTVVVLGDSMPGVLSQWTGNLYQHRHEITRNESPEDIK